MCVREAKRGTDRVSVNETRVEAEMAGMRDDTGENPVSEPPASSATTPTPATPAPVIPTLPYAPVAPLFPPLPVRQPSALERWRVPLIVALATVFLVFGALDISSILMRPAQDTGTTRPLVVNAQVIADATPATHPDLGLAPGTLTVACGKTGAITITNRSARPLQWTIATDSTDGDALIFTANTARTGLLAPGQSVTLTVMAFSQPGAYLLHVTDDHGESGDVTVQVSC